MTLDKFFGQLYTKGLSNSEGTRIHFSKNDFVQIIMGILVRFFCFAFRAFIVSHPIPNLVLNQNYFVDSECHLKFVFNHAMCAFSDLNLSRITTMLP